MDSEMGAMERQADFLYRAMYPYRFSFGNDGHATRVLFSAFCRGVIAYVGKDPASVVFLHDVIYEGGSFEAHARKKVLDALADDASIQASTKDIIGELTETEFHGGREGSGVHGKLYELLEFPWSVLTRGEDKNQAYTPEEMRDIERIRGSIQTHIKGASGWNKTYSARSNEAPKRSKLRGI